MDYEKGEQGRTRVNMGHIYPRLPLFAPDNPCEI